MERLRWLNLIPAAGAAGLLLLLAPTAPAPCPPWSAQHTTAEAAPAESSCVSCHTSRTALEPLVKPLPAAPSEGEG